MRADISIDEDQKLIRRTVTGQLTPERSLRIIYEMATVVKLHQDHNILIDIRDTAPVTQSSDMMAIAGVCSMLKSDFSSKIAFLVPGTQDRERTTEFWKACMVAQGFEFGKFYDDATALAWLSE